MLIPQEISILSFTLIGSLTAYIWNEQNKKIKFLREHQSNLPCNTICNEISVIKNDIQWIKNEIKKII